MCLNHRKMIISADGIQVTMQNCTAFPESVEVWGKKWKNVHPWVCVSEV